MIALARIVTLALAVTVGSATIARADRCIEPGDVMDVRNHLLTGTGGPDIERPVFFIDTDQRSEPVMVINMTDSRLRLLIPITTPFNTRFVIRAQHSLGLDTIVDVGRTCAQTGASAGIEGAPDLSAPQKVLTERATKNDVAAPSGAPEVVLVGDAKAVSKAEGIVEAAGGVVLRTRLLANMGLKMTAVDIGGALSLDQLNAELARKAVSVAADRHSVYRNAQGTRAYAGPMVGFDPGSPCRLPRTVRVGIIDGPIDATNPALQGVSIRSFSALNEDDLLGSTDHATGIASLIAGNGKTDLPAGIAQGAEIYSVVAFAKSGGRDVARLENIAIALDWMIKARVQVVNMSLAGPQNDTLADIVAKADAKGMVLVAAAGNGGLPNLAYPASDERVIGITAIDAARNLYRKANTGTGLDFAAPGVDVMVAGRSGTGFRSGTSYAAAIATGIVAQETARGHAGRSAVVSALRESAEDLGDTGPDTRFGYGLLQLGGC